MVKIVYWLIDYIHLTRGVVAMYWHKHPPSHYLDFILPDHTPVILLPGLLEKWGVMKNMGDYLSRQGHPVYIVPQLGYNIVNIPSAAKTVRFFLLHILPGRKHSVPFLPEAVQHIRELVDKHNLERVVFVAHSKGGLIGKYYMVHHNRDGRVKGLVAIATPFTGSKLAKLVPHDSFREMREGEKIINDLESHHAVNHKIISIFPKFDNHIWAKDSSFLEGAENICLNTYGHHKVLFNKQTKQLILDSIEKLARSPE